MSDLYGSGSLFFPVMRLAIKLITARMRKTANRILPISIDSPAMRFAPSKTLTSPKIKNIIAALNIHTPSDVLLNVITNASLEPIKFVSNSTSLANQIKAKWAFPATLCTFTPHMF